MVMKIKPAGTPPHVIAELTGHRQMAMVQRYSHLSPDIKWKAVKMMEQTFNGSEKVLNIEMTKI